MMSQRTRPHHLVYWVDECPPKPTMWLLGLQHVVVNSAGWVIMAAVLSAFVKDTRDIEAMVRLGMIVVGVVAILQARKASALGAGLFCPPICGPSYASATIAAGTGFGLGVVYGMTLLAGLFEVALARLMPRLRVLFPPEVIGVIMSVVGFAMLPLAIPRLLASPEFAPSMAGSRGANIAVAFGTLACIYGVTVWAKGRVRLFPVLIGAVVGLIGALILGVVPASAVEKIAQADWIGLPQRVNMDLGFELSLLVPFLVAALASALKGVGDLTICQKGNDDNWKRVDLQEVSRGGTALGIGTALAGLLGTMGHTSSSSNVGLSVIAAGATSRYIGYSMGALMIALAFVPKVGVLIALMPVPLMGATMGFVAATMIVAGLQILGGRLMDIRRILVVGTTLTFSIGVMAFPQSFAGAPQVIAPFLSSPVTLGAGLAIILALVLRIGSSKFSQFTLHAKDDAQEAIKEHFYRFGASVGARAEVVAQAAHSVYDALESLPASGGDAVSDLRFHLTFDEFSLSVAMTYEGPVMVAPAAMPTDAEMLDDPEAIARMSAYLAARKASKFSSEQQGRTSTLKFKFEH